MNEIRLSNKAKRLKRGKYKHYKNKYYEVLQIAIHSETLEELVVYRAQYGDKLTWVRPLDMLTETVAIDDKKLKRFVYIRV